VAGARQDRPELVGALGNLTMIQNLMGIENIDPVYWSLLVELKFYLVFALIVRSGLTYRRVLLFCVVWTTVALFAQATGFTLLMELLVPRYTPYFVAGITLYLMHRFGPNLVLWGMLFTSWILAADSLHRVISEAIQNGLPVNYPNALALQTVCFALLAAIALGWFSWIRWRGLTLIGALSYPIYLLHFNLSSIAFRELRAVPHWLQLAGVLVTVLALSYLVHRFVECPVSTALRRGLREAFDDIRRHSAPAAQADLGGRHASGPHRASLREKATP
jgi:peptidoglycan/LPS O-acetylase OafA/YrhL